MKNQKEFLFHHPHFTRGHRFCFGWVFFFFLFSFSYPLIVCFKKQSIGNNSKGFLEIFNLNSVVEKCVIF